MSLQRYASSHNVNFGPRIPSGTRINSDVYITETYQVMHHLVESVVVMLFTVELTDTDLISFNDDKFSKSVYLIEKFAEHIIDQSVQTEYFPIINFLQTHHDQLKDKITYKSQFVVNPITFTADIKAFTVVEVPREMLDSIDECIIESKLIGNFNEMKFVDNCNFVWQ